MIIVLKAGSSDAEVEDVCRRIERMGYRAHTIRGEVRTVIGAVGDDRGKERLKSLESLEYVETVQPILQPFKLASREVRQESTVVPVDGVRVGGRAIVVMAAVLGGVARAGARGRREGQGGGRLGLAGRRLQAAHVAVLLPGARGGGAQVPRRGQARDGPSRRDRGHGAREGRAGGQLLGYPPDRGAQHPELLAAPL